MYDLHIYEKDADLLSHHLSTAERFRKWNGLENAPYLGQPVIVSEFGGPRLAEEQLCNTEAWGGYWECKGNQELLRSFEEQVTAVRRHEHIVGDCWTQDRDTAHERNGLRFSNRKPKVDPTAIATINARPTAAELSWRH